MPQAQAVGLRECTIVGSCISLMPMKSPLKFLLNPVRLLKSLELARRTMRERADFVCSSPDRVRKRDFYIPLDGRGITRFRMSMAPKLLQFIGGHEVSLEPRFLSAEQARSHPLLRLMRDQARLQGAFCFAEYQYVWPERIVIDTILKGRAAGLDARNYTRLIKLEHGPEGWMATLEHQGRTCTVTAKAVVNAAGAWVDHVTRLALPSAPQLNSGAKGVNLLVRLPDAARGYGMETVTSHGTPFYVMPWGDMRYIGPVDSPAEPVEIGFRATDVEIEQILANANQLLPDCILVGTT